MNVSLKFLAMAKKVHPHKLRHSRATFLASKLTEAQMNQIFGWKQGSDMPSIYVHLSGRDMDDAILGVYGFSRINSQAFFMRSSLPLAPSSAKTMSCQTVPLYFDLM